MTCHEVWSIYQISGTNWSITKTKVTLRSLHGVYAYEDRYRFFREKGERQMAGCSLRAANMLLTDLLYRMRKDADGQELRETVKRVSVGMTLKLDWRVAYLVKAWFLFLFRKE